MRAGLALAALGFVAGACSGGELQRDAGQLPIDTGGSVDSTIPPGGFVTGDVDGITIRTDQQAFAYWFTGIQEGYLGIEGHSPDWEWILVIRNLLGPGSCPTEGYIVLQPAGMPTMGRATYAAGGTCTIEVTNAAAVVGNSFEGTFTATIARLGGGTTTPATVINGVFHVPRIADNP